MNECKICGKERETKYNVHLLFGCEGTADDREDHIAEDDWYDEMSETEAKMNRNRVYEFFAKWKQIGEDEYNKHINNVVDTKEEDN